MKSLITLSLLTLSSFLSAQYMENFTTPNRGILLGPCGSTANTCASINFAGVSWTISGNLSGIDTEGFFTVGSALQAADLDEEACWESPTLDIGSVGSSSFSINFTIPSGSTWENSTTSGSIDYMDVKYAVDGGPLILMPNQSGCTSSGHTISTSGCASNLVGPQTFTIAQAGIVGNSIKIFVCIDTNTSGDIGQLNSVSVPEAGTVLPVTWGNITGSSVEKDNLIAWSTVTEINNDYFEIERSENGELFEPISRISTSEYNNRSTKEYNYYDLNVTQRKSYYRIKQVDFDGKFDYSPTVFIENNNLNSNQLIFGPNPVRNNLMVKIKGEGNTGKTLQVIDMNGVVHKTINLINAYYPYIDIDCTLLPAGKYILQLKDHNNYINQEFIKL